MQRASSLSRSLFLASSLASRSFTSTPRLSSSAAQRRLRHDVGFRRFATDSATPEAEVVSATAEKPVGSSDKRQFQAETKKLLDIVARSLYTEREVFVRELVSNASDALEKLRHMQLLDGTIAKNTSDLPLEISIHVDSKKKTLTIQDTGLGMTKEELIENLGSIGHSGSKDFFKKLEGGKPADVNNLIGQFGVGFYSAFMVANKVTVYSKSALSDSKGYMWVSDGSGSYEITEAEGVARGTKIILELNDKSQEFSSKDTVEKIIKKYSNFVGFPIKMEGKQVNTVKALWLMSKDQITEKDHTEFYQFIAHAFDSPAYHMQYTTDSPINIRGLFYIGNQHSERYGMGRMDPGVNLFCKKVLIQAKAKGLLPEWLRFIKGVVDSEDIPLNISREHLQDSAVIRKIASVLTKRILKWLDEESKRDPAKYNVFWNEFGNFLKEGICTDIMYKDDVAKLCRMESSYTKADELTSLDDYIERMANRPSDVPKEIYYLCVPTRTLAETSPYYETFRARGIEVLFLYTALDDFVMTSMTSYKDHRLVSVESTDASPAKKPEAKKEEKESKKESDDKSEAHRDLILFMREALGSKISSIKVTDRLHDSPAIIIDHESASFRRMMKYVDPQRAPQLPKQQLAINPNHEIIKTLDVIRKSKPNLAKLVTEQIFDNAVAAAGLLDDARAMIPRITTLLTKALLTSSGDIPAPPPPPPSTSSTSSPGSAPPSDSKKEGAPATPSS